MHTLDKMVRKAALVVALAMGAGWSAANAQGPGPGYMGGGPMMQGGMMYGYGDGYDCPYGGWGGGPGSGGMLGPGRMMGPMMGWGPAGQGGAFSLNDEQRKKLQTLNENVWNQHKELQRKMLEQRNRLHQLQLDDNLDPDAIMKAQREMSELRLKMMESQMRAARDFEQSLSPEQRNQWRQMNSWGWGNQ